MNGVLHCYVTVCRIDELCQVFISVPEHWQLLLFRVLCGPQELQNQKKAPKLGFSFIMCSFA